MTTRGRSFLVAILVTLAAVIPGPAAQPNIIVVLADDIGYGDLGSYGAKSVHTPNLDRLAREGLRFTDAHSPAAVCTPTRYSLLTGQYSFRHRPGASILSGIAPLCITTDRMTVPKLLRQNGYATGIVGKWHLGLGDKETDYNAEITPGPREVGFDYSFIIPATGDRTPCVFVENGRVVNYDPKDPIKVSYTAKIGNDPTGKENPELLTNQKPSHGHDATIVNGISRIGWMTGGHAARWKDEDTADTLTTKAAKFIGDNKAKPFFLYFATHDAHVPRVPHPRFRGKSPHGLRGDCIEQMDWCVGELLKTLAEHKLDQNTIVIFTSDNGGVMDDGYIDGTQDDKSGHQCNGALRGKKSALHEGGHRVPFIVRWPGVAPAGNVSNELICHVDLMATFAELTGTKLPAGAGPDSVSQLAAFRSEQPARICRTELIHQAGNVNNLALRQGVWKLIPAVGKAEPQLYNLKDDLSETKNQAKLHQDRVTAMAARLAELRK